MPRCVGEEHAWIWPRDISSDGYPPDDWPCVCGKLYPNGDKVQGYNEQMPQNIKDRCPRCNERWYSHPTTNCKVGTGLCPTDNKPWDDHPVYGKCEKHL